jgi:hypothetical protein
MAILPPSTLSPNLPCLVSLVLSSILKFYHPTCSRVYQAGFPSPTQVNRASILCLVLSLDLADAHCSSSLWLPSMQVSRCMFICCVHQFITQDSEWLSSNQAVCSMFNSSTADHGELADAKELIRAQDDIIQSLHSKLNVTMSSTYSKHSAISAKSSFRI